LSPASKQLDALAEKIDALQATTSELSGQIGEMIRAEDARAKDTAERRGDQKELNEKLDRRLLKVERIATMATAYATVATFIVGALITWLFRLLPG
jgi:uncharacterized coiled-coil DUF342 family protein